MFFLFLVIRILFWSVVVLAALLLFGCAGQAMSDEDREYERADRQVLFLERYYEFATQCRAAGGSVIVDRRGYSPRYCRWRNCPPEHGDTYRCGKL